jgi:hypothetical protein
MIENSFTKYNIPRKQGIEKGGLALAWPKFYLKEDQYLSQEKIEEVFEKELSLEKYQKTFIKTDIFLKYRNTKDFYLANSANAIDYKTLSFIDSTKWRL